MRNIWIGGLLSGLFVALALLSYVWTPGPVDGVDIPNKLLGPSAAHWLGTDHYGRDILSMIMVGARTSIAVAIVAVGIGMALGIPLGLLSAARAGGWIDEIVMRGNDLIFAFPSLVIAILITAVFGASAVNAIIAIGIFNIPVFARLSRGAALSLWSRDFILAARVAGKGRARISVEHILPNIASLMIVQGTIQFSLGILAEAALSYVGLGAQPPSQAGAACSPTPRPWSPLPPTWRSSPASPSSSPSSGSTFSATASATSLTPASAWCAHDAPHR